MDAFSRAVEKHAGSPLRIEVGPWPECPDRLECLREWAVLSPSSSIVLLSAFGGLSRLRIVAERIPRGQTSGLRVIGDVPMASAEWGPPLAGLAEQLFEREELGAPPLSVAPVLAPSSSALPWVLGGIAAAGAVVAVGLALSSASARSQLPDTLLSSAEYDPLRGRAEGHAYAAAAFGSGAIVCGAVAITLSVLE